MRLALGSDLPAAVLGRAQQGRKAGARVKSRQTQPIDRTIAIDQRGRVTVANQGVIFDPASHLRKPHGMQARLAKRVPKTANQAAYSGQQPFRHPLLQQADFDDNLIPIARKNDVERQRPFDQRQRVMAADHDSWQSDVQLEPL